MGERMGIPNRRSSTADMTVDFPASFRPTMTCRSGLQAGKSMSSSVKQPYRVRSIRRIRIVHSPVAVSLASAYRPAIVTSRS